MFGLWEEVREPGEKPRRHREKCKRHTERSQFWEFSPREAAARTTAPPCHVLSRCVASKLSKKHCRVSQEQRFRSQNGTFDPQYWTHIQNVPLNQNWNQFTLHPTIHKLEGNEFSPSETKQTFTHWVIWWNICCIMA